MKAVIDLIGGTPMVHSKKLNPNPNVELWFKLEGQNPGGSIKDRAALHMINTALAKGEIDSSTRLIEATSGNTGIALAMICAAYGLAIEIVLPENSSIERIKTMRAYGAKVTLTPASGQMEAARDYASEKVIKERYYSFNQFDNPANSEAHYLSTGPEIWKDTSNKVTHFVATMGTTGTITGTGKFLKEMSEGISIHGVQPKEGAKIPGIRKWEEAYLPKIYNSSFVDVINEVSEEEAIAFNRRLSNEEGIFAGISSGGAVKVGVDLCAQLEQGIVVCIICDRGDRYLSTGIF